MLIAFCTLSGGEPKVKIIKIINNYIKAKSQVYAIKQLIYRCTVFSFLITHIIQLRSRYHFILKLKEMFPEKIFFQTQAHRKFEKYREISLLLGIVCLTRDIR